MKNKQSNPFITVAAVTVAAFIMAVNYKTFVLTGGLYPGGVASLSLLLIRLIKSTAGFELPFSVVNIALNAGPVYIGFRYLGKRFTLFSCLLIIENGIFTDLIPAYTMTEDILLITIFGGIIDGAAISICLNYGATSGGTDFISIFLSEKRGIDSFGIILAFNAVVISIAGLNFGWDKALYSIIFQYVTTSVIHLLFKKYRQSTFFIVTETPDEVCKAIDSVSGHGATILKGEGSYEHSERNVVYSVVSSAQSKRVINAVHEVDPEAFINEVKTEKLKGNFYLPKEE